MSYQLLWRDRFVGPYTGLSFNPAGCHIVPQASRIFPFSFCDQVHVLHCGLWRFTLIFFCGIQQALTLSTLETFAGWTLADEAVKMINHPSTAFNAESNAHESYDNLAWGIEPVEANGQ